MESCSGGMTATTTPGSYYNAFECDSVMYANPKGKGTGIMPDECILGKLDDEVKSYDVKFEFSCRFFLEVTFSLYFTGMLTYQQLNMYVDGELRRPFYQRHGRKQLWSDISNDPWFVGDDRTHTLEFRTNRKTLSHIKFFRC